MQAVHRFTGVPTFLGLAYRGTADPEVVTQAIATACRSATMTFEISEGGRHLHGIQTASWYVVLLRGLPQRTDWRLEPLGNETRIYSDFRAFLWFRMLAAVVTTSMIFCTAAAVAAEPVRSRSDLLDQGGWILGVLGCLLVLLFLRQGVSRVAEFRQQVLLQVRDSGGQLEPVGLGVSLRFGLTVGPLLAFVLSFTAWYLGKGPGPGSAPNVGAKLLIVAMLLFAFLFLLTAVLMLRRAAFGLRVAPLILGLQFAFVMLFFSSPILLWLGAGLTTGLAGLGAPGLDAEGSRRLLLVSLLPPFLGASFFCWMLQTVGAYSQILMNYQASRHIGIYREATRGDLFLRSFQATFLVIMLLFATFFLVTSAILAATILDILLPGFLPSSPLLLPNAILRQALGDIVGTAGARVLAAAGWSVLGVAVVALLLASVGQLALAERSERRRLRAARTPVSPQVEDLQRTVDEAARRNGLGKVYVVAGSTPSAAAHVFGPAFRERYVEISALCVRGMAEDELRTLAAHELAHHFLGHAIRYRLLRWLGRFAFVGDGFVRTLLASWINEEEADRVAIELFGGSPVALARALRKLHAVADVRRHLSTAGRGGLRLRADDPRDLDKAPFPHGDGAPPTSSLRECWKLFLRHYFQPSDFHYWYPPRGERSQDLAADEGYNPETEVAAQTQETKPDEGRN